MTVGINEAGAMRQEGILDATATSVKEGDALYWDDDAKLRICGVNDHYRYAGQAFMVGEDDPAGAGDRCGVDTEGIRTGYGDGASTYLKGKMLTTGALGTLVPYIGEKLLAHTVTLGEAGALAFDLPDYIDHVLVVRNVTKDTNKVIVEADETLQAGQCKVTLPTGTALGSLSFFAAEIAQNDVVNVVYVPKNGVIGKLVGEPDGDEKLFVQLGGR